MAPAQRKTLFLYLLLFGMLLVERIKALIDFSFNYVGGDDLIFWQGAADYARGIFHEPYFYGQSYNIMLEALFAVPLIKFHVPLNYALPISSTFISLFPFFLFSIVLYRNRYTSAAFMFLAIPLCLPPLYSLTCGMSRGFVQGLFFSGFFVYPLLKPGTRRSWVLAALAASFGYIHNPNSLIVAFPVCIYLLFYNYKQIWFYILGFIGVLPAMILHYFAQRFYELNPTYIVHKLWPLAFNISAVFDNLKHLDNVFTFFTPVFWVAGWLSVILIFLAGLLIWKSDKTKAISLLLVSFFIIFSLGINKVNDRIDDFLFSSSRMYLGIPLLIAISFFWLNEQWKTGHDALCRYIVIVCVTVWSVKLGIAGMVVKEAIRKSDAIIVAMKPVDELKCECEKIKVKAQETNAEIVLFSTDWQWSTKLMIFLNYGCPLLVENMPPTLLSNYERRTWVYLKETQTIHKSILFHGHTWIEPENFEMLCKRYNFDRSKFYFYDKVYHLSGTPPMLPIKNNTLSLDSLYRLLRGGNFKEKRYIF